MIKFLFHLLSELKREYVIFNYSRRFKTCKIHSFVGEEWLAKLQPYTTIEKGVTLLGQINYLGKGLYVGANSLVYNCESIGNYCSISADVKIGLEAHPKHLLSTSPLFYKKSRGVVSENKVNINESKKVIIGHDVLISANVLILNGIKIGTGSIIGAGAVITKDVPEYAIVAGVPGRIIGYRFDENMIDYLLRSEWWNMNIEEIQKFQFPAEVKHL